MDKILQTTSYIETARLAVQYQFSFSSCKEIIQEHSTLLQLSEFKQTSAIISSNTSSYPLCISFKLSVLTNLDFPHQYRRGDPYDCPAHSWSHSDVKHRADPVQPPGQIPEVRHK